MKKKILAITILALALCMAIAFVRPVMAAEACTGDTCAETCKTNGCDGKCGVECCPVQIGDKCYPTLEDAVTAASNNDTITLRADVELSKNVQVNNKTITINGNGFSISGSDAWYNEGGSGDQAIITSLNGSKVTLQNITLKHGPKQGAQAYGTGTLILDDVKIEDCKYSALIAHGGTIVIKDVKLNTVAGIEVALKSDETVGEEFTVPTIQMDGTITKSSEGPIVYADTSTTPKELDIQNTESSQDKMYINGSSVVVTDKDNNVKYEGAPLGENIKIDVKVGNKEAAKVFVVTINYNGETKIISVKEGETLPDLTDVKEAVEGKKFVKFLKADGTDYNESAKITANLTLVAVYEDITPEKPAPETPTEKDETPKTGVIDVALVASVVAMVSAAGIVAVKRYSR